MNVVIDFTSPCILYPVIAMGLLIYVVCAGVAGGLVAREIGCSDARGFVGFWCGLFWPVTILVLPAFLLGKWVAGPPP